MPRRKKRTLAAIRKVQVQGNSLSIELPSQFYDIMKAKDSWDTVYAKIEGGKIVYRWEGSKRSVKLKIRACVRSGRRIYYSVTIPKRFAEKIKIGKGDKVHVVLSEGEIVVSRL